ncbi:MAG TPA: gephyrin-like molybdotransferase Glp [Geobacteraceae bacterium]|nr:gephyrin-like molybdotransferase Glp [Geobacteraceae bacterium]
MVSIQEAQSIIFENTRLLPSEDIPLLKGLGRVICEDVCAPWDFPAFDNSGMDGYAFCHSAMQGDRLEVAGFLPAGSVRNLPVEPGKAVRIMTGAPIPPGCDTVVPVERIEETDEGIRITEDIKTGSHVRKRGDDVRSGARVIAAGTVLRPQEIAMLASCGLTTARVFTRPKIGVLATGDELVEPGERLSPGKIINSNSSGIAAQVLEAGGEPMMLGIAHDEENATRTAILAGLEADILITTGGVSVGDRDRVRETIAALGGKIGFWKVNMKPGKPVAFAVLQGKPIFALPGNPVAAMVSFEMFVRPAILKMAGHTRIFRSAVRAELMESIKNSGDRPHLIRLFVDMRNGRYVASTTGSQGSARLSSLTEGNGLATIAPGASLSTGEKVEVFLFDRRFEMCSPGRREHFSGHAFYSSFHEKTSPEKLTR